MKPDINQRLFFLFRMKWMRRALLMTSLFMSPALIASSDCLQFRIVGVCLWIVPYPFNIEVTIKYGHFNPDAVIVVERAGLILDQDVTTYSAEDTKRIADDTYNRNHDNLMYKEATATGNPLAGEIMCPSHSDTTIYFKSEADIPSWKWVGLDILAFTELLREIGPSSLLDAVISTVTSSGETVSSVLSGVSDIVNAADSSDSSGDSSSGNDTTSSLSAYAASITTESSEYDLSGGWNGGGIYPRSGWVIQHSDSKGGGVIAHRVGDIITREDQPHIYDEELAEGNSVFIEDDYFTWAPGPLEENTNEEGWFQPILPELDFNCYVIGEKDSDQYLDDDGEYTWMLWRPYTCCEIDAGFLIDINIIEFPEKS